MAAKAWEVYSVSSLARGYCRMLSPFARAAAMRARWVRLLEPGTVRVVSVEPRGRISFMECILKDGLAKKIRDLSFVIPAEAGIQ
jgi:hypothetical protein